MAKLFYDTEFLEDGATIALISIGMVREDGAELYCVNRDMPTKRIAKHAWLRANVVPSLPRIHGDRRHYVSARRNPLALDFDHPAMMSRHRIAAEVEHFVLSTPDVELWAWYGSFDHVVLSWLFGPMAQHPPGVPMFTCDLRQEAARLGLTDADMPKQASGHHNALADARHNKVIAEFLAAAEQDGEESR